jgi:hypothetical protein
MYIRPTVQAPLQGEQGHSRFCSLILGHQLLGDVCITVVYGWGGYTDATEQLLLTRLAASNK